MHCQSPQASRTPPPRLHTDSTRRRDGGDRRDPRWIPSNLSRSTTNQRIIAAIVLVAVLAVGGGIIATTAYQAGVNTAVTQAAADGATVVNPVVVPAYGYGWHPFGFGFGFFGFLFTLFFLFIVFAPDPGHRLGRPWPARRLGRTRLGRPGLGPRRPS